MKKRSIGSVILTVLLGILAAVVVLAVAAFLVVKFYILPNYVVKLSEQGHSELANVVENNNNLSAFASLGSLLADKDVIDFVSNLDRQSAGAVLDVLDTLDAEYTEQPTPSPAPQDKTWKVKDIVPTPKPISTPVPVPAETAPPAAPEQYSNTASSAYERIAAAASAQDMADGLRIISKLDMGYVSSLTADGLTKAEKSELKKYVKTVLSSSEISRALALYRAYSKYL